MYAKKLSFASGIFMSESFEGRFQRDLKQLPLVALTAHFFLMDVLVFEISRETDQKKVN